MRIEAIERLIRRLETSDITQIELVDATGSLTLRFGQPPARPATAPGVAEAPAPTEPRSLRARAIGRLRLRHPDAANEAEAPFPRAVVAGDVVAFLDAGPLLRPILAEEDGTIGAPLLAEGALVGYGTPVFPLL